MYIYIYLAESMGLEMFSTRAIDELGTVSGMNVVHLESGKLLLCSNRIWFPGFAGARDSPRMKRAYVQGKGLGYNVGPGVTWRIHRSTPLDFHPWQATLKKQQDARSNRDICFHLFPQRPW
jgi:hypothetical protein